jgi:hypothetical protein
MNNVEEKCKSITVEDLFRLRAASTLTNLEYKRSGNSKIPFCIYKKGLHHNPIALVGNEYIAQYLSSINEIVDLALALSDENTKLRREVGKQKRLENIF